MNINDNIDEIQVIQGKTLAKLPYKVDNIDIYPPTLLQIFDIGEDKYNYYLNLISMNTNKAMQYVDESTMSANDKDLLATITTFDMLIINILEDEKLLHDVIEMLQFFLCKENEKINFVKNNRTIYFYINDIEDEKIIHRNNFDNIVNVIKIQNDVWEIKEEKKYNPANKKVSEFIKKMEARKAKLNKLKKKNQINMYDLISILASNSKSLNILNIWELNIHQFNNQLARLQINENYELQKFLLGNPYAGESIDLDKNNYFKKIAPQINDDKNNNESKDN